MFCMASTTADFLVSFKDELRLTTKELALEFHLLTKDKPVTKTRLENWIYSKSEIPDWVDEAVETIRAKFSSKGTPSKVVNGMPMVTLEVIVEAAAGDGEHAVDFNDDRVDVPEFMTYPGCIGVYVRHDSMMPRLHEGDAAIFQPNPKLTTGMTYLLKNGEGYRIKKVKWRGGVWYAHSINPAYQDEPLFDTQVLGRLTGVFGQRSGAWYCLSSLEGLELPELDEPF